MCEATCSESGQLLTINPCGWCLVLKSDRDRLAGVVTGMEEQNARNLDALRRANVRAGEREADNVMRITALKKQLGIAKQENARLREALKAVEWNGPRFESCPYCNEAESNGHYDDCLIGNALKEVG